MLNSAKAAEIVLDYTTLPGDVAANRGPYSHGASMALKSQMRAYVDDVLGHKRFDAALSPAFQAAT